MVGATGPAARLFSFNNMTETGRQPLPHERPLWLSTNHAYFITTCVTPRGENHLAKSEIAEALIESFAWRHENSRWHGLIFLIMPDHVHFVAVESPDHSLTKEIHDWKKYTGRTLGISWQRDFFEHRLRHDESRSEKYEYILNNPVRAGLVEKSDDWAFRWSPLQK